MALTTSGKNDAAEGVTDTITHIGLLDETGTELAGGSYARKAVTWGSASNGVVKPTGDLTFDVPAETTVGGWAGYTASTSGTQKATGTVDQEVYNNAGQYVLEAASTSITIADPA